MSRSRFFRKYFDYLLPAKRLRRSRVRAGRSAFRLSPVAGFQELLESRVMLSSVSGYKWDDVNGNRIRDTDLLSGDQPDVIFVIDQSGSTTSTFGGGSVGDVNGDGRVNTILDAELAAFIAMNQNLIDRGLGTAARVAIVPFGSSATHLDLDVTTDGVQAFTHPSADTDGNGVYDIVDVLKSIRSSGGTNFESPLQESIALLNSVNSGSNGNVVFLSDGAGGGFYDDEVQALNAAGTNIRAFGVGTGASLTRLQEIDPRASIFTSTDEILQVFQGLTGGTVRFTEPTLSGWTIYVDTNNNGLLDNGEPSDVTDQDGLYRIDGLSAGTHILREVQQAGWVQTFPGPDTDHHLITLGDSTNATAHFGNRRAPNVEGTVWRDENENALRDISERGFAGVEVYLDLNNNGVRDAGEESTFTDINGHYRFFDVPPGDYVVRQTLNNGDIQTSPQGYFGTAYFSTPNPSSTTYLTQITVGNGTGIVHRLGNSPHSVRIWGLAVTGSGEFIGSSSQSQSFHRLDPSAGGDSVIGPAGVSLFGGFTYVASTDTSYAIGFGGGSSQSFLMEVDVTSGAVTPIGPGIDSLQALSALTWDWTRNRFVAFDNFDDEFYEIDLQGNFQKLSDLVTAPLHSWTLIFNGTDYLMADNNDPGQILRVDPDIGQYFQAFRLSEPIVLEDLEFVKNGNIGHHITVTGNQRVTDLDFGRNGIPADILISETGTTQVTEAGSTDTFRVSLSRQPHTDVVINIDPDDSTEVAAVTQTVTLTPSNWNTGVVVTVRGVDDSVIDGDIVSSVVIAVQDDASDVAFRGETTSVLVTTLDDDLILTNTFITGQVWRDDNRDGVWDANELPLTGAQLYLDLNDNARRDPGEPLTPSEANGVFRFAHIQPGAHVVRQILTIPTFQSSPQAYVGMAYFNSGTQTRFYQMNGDTGQVLFAAQSTQTLIDGVALTRNGRVFGTSVSTNSLYEVDRQTGVETQLGSWGAWTVRGLTYDSATDTLYAVGREGTSQPWRLLIVDRRNANVIPVGTGGMVSENFDAAAFDSASRRIVLFDNTTDTFYEMDLQGDIRQLATASPAIDSDSLTYDGSRFVMQLRQGGDQRQLISVDPDTGHWQSEFRSSLNINSEALEYVRLGDVAHRVTVGLGQTASGLVFGQFTVPPGFTVLETDGTTRVSESGVTDSFDVTLDRRPDFPVVINVHSANPSLATVDTQTLVFTRDDWNIAQRVTVAGVNNEDADGTRLASVVLQVNRSLSDDAFDFLPDSQVQVTVIDDDTPGITVSSSVVQVAESSSNQFTVVLNSQPDRSVAIDLISADTAEVTVFPAVLTFQPSAWDVPQTVTLNAVDDIEVDGNHIVPVTLSVRDNASDDSYDPLADIVVNAFVVDNDGTGIYVDKSTLTVHELSGRDSFDVVLTSPPSSNVVLTVGNSDPAEVAVDRSTLVFTPSNWNVPQRVIATGLSDNLLDGNQQITLTLTVDPERSDDNYDAVSSQDVVVTNVDANFAALSLSVGTLKVSEDGTSSAFTLTLRSAPASPVTFNISSSDTGEVVVGTTSVTFTPENWQTGQTVFVTGVDDIPIDGPQVAVISIAVDPDVSDDAFDNSPLTIVNVTNVDNDFAGFTLSSHTATVSESGTRATFTVVLNTTPASDVVLNVGRQSHGEVAESPFMLTFTPQNWNVPQVVTLRGIDDSETDGDQQTDVNVAVSPLFSDDAFDELPLQTVVVTTLDDDLAEALPTVTGPGGRLTLNDLPTLTWNSVPGAESYEVWLERIGGSSNPIANPTVARLNFTLDANPGIGRYRTWVRAIFANNTKSSWTTGTFIIDGAATINDLPFHGEDRTPVVSWQAVPGAQSYRVYVSNTTTGQSAIIDQVVTGTSFTPSVPFDFGKHRIWVRAIGDSNFGAAWSRPEDYYIGPAVTGPGTSTFSQQPQFSWTPLPGVGSYQLYVQHGNTVVINQSGIAGNTFVPDAPMQVGLHRWWIRPFTAAGQPGAWSPLQEVFVGGQPKVTGPVGAIVSSIPLIEWDAVDGAESYEVYLLNDDGLGLVQRVAGIAETSFQSPPLQNGDYRVWVRSFRTGGEPGLWSRAQSFTVNSNTINLPVTLISPLLPAFDSTPEFQWTADASAAGFDVFLSNGVRKILVENVATSSWTPTSPLEEGEWRWQVRAANSGGTKGEWSSVGMTDLSGRAVLVAPVGSVSDSTPVFQWHSVIGAGRYVLQVDNLTTDQAAVIREDQLSGTSYTPTTPLAAGSYRAWVRAISNNNNAAPWSFKVDFVITLP